jgi:hypothetical protein
MKQKILLVVSGLLAMANILFAGDARLLFKTPSGGPRATGAGDSVGAGFSNDGRYVLFSSSANDLVAAPLNNQVNVFLRDRVNNSTRLISGGLNGAIPNADAEAGGISADNRYVVFQSSSSNLVADDTNGFADIFLRDLSDDSITRITANANGPSAHPLISADGKWVVFETFATNLGAQDANNASDVFAWRRTDGAMKLVTATATGGASAQISVDDFEISADSRYVLFSASGPNLATGDTTYGSRVYLRDLDNDSTRCVSDPVLQTGFPNAFCGPAVLSTNSRYVYVVFGTNAVASLARVDLNDNSAVTCAAGIDYPLRPLARANAISASDNGEFAAYVKGGAVYRWNAATGVSDLADVADAGISDTAQISHNGAQISFWSDKPALTGSADPRQLFLRKFSDPAPVLVSPRIGAQLSVETSVAPAKFSTDDSLLIFESANSDLVANDSNNSIDLFTYTLATQSLSLISATINPAATASNPGVTLAANASANGQRIALQTWASFNLSDSNSLADVYVFDRALNTNLLMSLAANGATATNGAVTTPMISGDGNSVAFASSAKGLAGPNDVRTFNNIYLRTFSDTGYRTFAPSSGSLTLGGISADGRFVFYQAQVSPVTPVLNRYDSVVQTNSGISGSIFRAASSDGQRVIWGPTTYRLFDYGSGITTLLESGLPSLSTDGRTIVIQASSSIVATNLESTVRKTWPIRASALAVSDNGKTIAFQVGAVLFNSTNQIGCIDYNTERTNIISRRFDGAAFGNNNSEGMTISADGRFIAFESWASDLVENDANGAKDVFLYDTVKDRLTLVSHAAGSDHAANGASLNPMFAGPDTLIFQSSATDLTTDGSQERMGLYVVTLDRSLPMILEIAVGNGGSRNVVVKGSAGTRFQLEYNSVLSPEGWTNMGPETVLGSTDAVIADDATNTQRFYRARLIQ